MQSRYFRIIMKYSSPEETTKSGVVSNLTWNIKIRGLLVHFLAVFRIYVFS